MARSDKTLEDILDVIFYDKPSTQDEIAEKYFIEFTNQSGMDIRLIQRWIPIVAATQLEKYSGKEEEFLRNWINIAEY